jgi:hypothetical protein
MTGLTTAFDTELQKPAVLLFGAVEILLPGYALRLVDGAGELTFGGHTFIGRDATYGVLVGLTNYADGIDDQAPSLTLTFHPPSNAAMAALAAPTAQGSQVSIWVGALDVATGLVIADPDLCFIGETDVPTNRVDPNTRSVDLTVVSIFERFFDQDEGARLNNGFHQSVWPGETGLEYVGRVRQPPTWGSNAPRNLMAAPTSGQGIVTGVGTYYDIHLS